MIKKRFGWFDIYYAEMLLGIAFAIKNACTGSWSVTFVWFGFVISWGIFKLVISEKNRRYKALVTSQRKYRVMRKKLCRIWYGFAMSCTLKCSDTD